MSLCITSYFPMTPPPSVGLVMIGVIIGSRKVGINPDNVATPIAASLGDLITLSLLAGVSSTLYEYIGEVIQGRRGMMGAHPRPPSHASVYFPP